MGKIIGVLSLKGGVGKTSTVISLGAAMSDFGKRVLLIDGNLSAPNLGLHLNVFEPEITLHNVLNRSANIDEAIYGLGDFDIMPSSSNNKLNINPLILKDRIKNLKNRYDVIILDSSPALNDETLAVILASDELIVVTTPDFPTLSTTLKAVKIAKERDTPVVGLVINKVYNKNFELSLRDIEKTAEVPVIAIIPHDVSFLKALSRFVPPVLYKPNSKGSEEYKKLAATLVGEKYNPFRLRNFFRLSPRRQEVNRAIYYESIFGQ